MQHNWQSHKHGRNAEDLTQVGLQAGTQRKALWPCVHSSIPTSAVILLNLNFSNFILITFPQFFKLNSAIFMLYFIFHIYIIVIFWNRNFYCNSTIHFYCKYSRNSGYIVLIEAFFSGLRYFMVYSRQQNWLKSRKYMNQISRKLLNLFHET